MLARAILALKPRHAGLVHPAQQELPELALLAIKHGSSRLRSRFVASVSVVDVNALRQRSPLPWRRRRVTDAARTLT